MTLDEPCKEAKATIPIVVYIGDRLKALREQRLLTQKMLAERSGLSQVAIARIERNRAEPHFSTIHKLAAALNVEPSKLVG